MRKPRTTSACTKDGGAIEVTANDGKDSASRDRIQMHLSHVAGMFAAGNFKAPMPIHDRTPVHEFLRFQITDHKTGDPLDVK